jgi:pilus assembly protein CpaB
MRGKSLFLLLLALGCGLVASVGITRVMAKRTTDAPAAAEMETVIVAVKDLPLGDPVNLEWVKEEGWPKGRVPPGAITRKEDLEKRRPKTRIFAGTVVLDSQLFGQGEAENTVGQHIPPGYRVVPIEVDSVSGAGGMARPGDRVDLLLSVQTNPGKHIHETSTRTILQDVKVFAVNDRFRLEDDESDKSIALKTVSLLVTPEQAQKVTLATELGRIRLALRSPEDQEQPKVGPSSPTDLFGLADGSKREHESQGVALLGAKSDQVDDFLKFLRGQQPPQPAAPREEPKTCFNMRIIAGVDVRDVRMELASGAGASDVAGIGFPLWKSAAPGAEPSVAPPAQEPDEDVPSEPTPSEASPAKKKPKPAEPNASEVQGSETKTKTKAS